MAGKKVAMAPRIPKMMNMSTGKGKGAPKPAPKGGKSGVKVKC